MAIYTSYFYQVRFMRPTDIPMSTAVWDPKWFHDFKGQDYMFLDKRGVLNGLRASMFAPDDTCKDLCRGLENCPGRGQPICQFLSNYRKQLDKLDAHQLSKFLEQLAPMLQKATGNPGPFNHILLLHEAPTNPCSERGVIQQWFAAAGITVEEWQPTK